MRVTISKWGNSLGIRIPANIVEAMKLKQGDAITYELQGNQLVLKKEISTRELFEEFYGKPYEKITPADIGEGGELDWGEDLGGEIF